MGYSSALLAVEGIDGWKEYFVEHHLVAFFTQLLATLGDEQPADPLQYIATYASSHGPPQTVMPASPAEAANTYFDSHDLKPMIAHMLMELSETMPEDPYLFMHQYISSNRPKEHSTPSADNWGRQVNGKIPNGTIPPEPNSPGANAKGSTAQMDSFFTAWKQDKKMGARMSIAGSLSKDIAMLNDDNSIDVLLDWDTDALAMSEEELVKKVYQIFDSCGYLDGVNKTALKAFIQKVFYGYSDENPYHNFKHAYSVFAGTTSFVKQMCPDSMFSPVEQMSMSLAGLCHDIGHESYNNDFYIKLRHKIAIRYNDAAVLENMHAARAFEIMLEEECNFTKHMSAEDYALQRKIMIAAILNTDMKVHFGLTEELKKLSDLCTEKGGVLNLEEKEQEDVQNLLLKAMVHAADISNSVLREDLAHGWAYRVVLEFHNQAKKEQELGLPFAPFMEPHPDNKVALASLQIGFSQFIVSPFWTPLSVVMPGLKPRIDQLQSNAKYWADFKVAAQNELA
jgi:hypothetical protein